MGVAEELADVWRDVPDKPRPGKEAEYFALLLRLTLDSKKRVEETGRRYATLPTLRDLIRKRIVRVPAEHVKWLEISAFDLVANPLKKSLAAYVTHLMPKDAPLVEWFVHAAKKDPSLALDVKALEAWLSTQSPQNPAAPSIPSGERNPNEVGSSPAASEKKETPSSAETSRTDHAQNSETKPAEGSNASENAVAPDRVFESS